MTLRNRYPDADILAQRGHWDDATRQVVLDRVHNVPPFSHFDAAPAGHARGAVRARDAAGRTGRPTRRMPIAPWIDAALRTGGTWTASASTTCRPPSTPGSWGLDGLDQTAQALFGEQRASASSTQAQQDQRAGGASARRPAGRGLAAPAGQALVGVRRAAADHRRLLRPSLRLGRDRLRRAGLSARLLRAELRRARALGAREVGDDAGRSSDQAEFP